MDTKYLVSNDYLAERGLDLNDYALEGTLINAIIQLGYDLAITRICYLDDSLSQEKIENDLDVNLNKIDIFYKLQYRIIYNLVFQNENDPLDRMVDHIIVHELKWGKINGWQKGLFYK